MAQVSSREQKTSSGMAWTLGRALIQLIVGVGVGVILARLLPPRDFGLVAIAMGFGLLAEALALAGLGAALIQRPKIRRRDIEVTLLLSIALAALFVALFALAAPVVAQLYETPELVTLLVLVGLTQGVMTLGVVPRAMLRRHLQHRTLALIELVSYLLGYAVVSIALAWAGWGALSLAIGLLVWWTLSTLLCWAVSGSWKWRPHWSARHGWAILRYGLTLSSKSFLIYFGAALPALLLGGFLGPEALGLFQRAAQLALLPLQRLAASIGHVLFPAYALIQDQPAKLKETLLAGQQTLALICFPILAAFIAVPETVIVGLYGPEWAAAAPLLQILAGIALLNIVHHLFGPLVEATGRAAQEVRIQIVYLGILATAILLATPFGLLAVAWAHLIPELFLTVAMGRLALAPLQIGLANWLAASRYGLLLGVATALAALAAEQVSELLAPGQALLTLFAVSFACATVYLVGLWRLPGPHQQWWRHSPTG